jgi:hypothetical protein
VERSARLPVRWLNYRSLTSHINGTFQSVSRRRSRQQRPCKNVTRICLSTRPAQPVKNLKTFVDVWTSSSNPRVWWESKAIKDPGPDSFAGGAKCSDFEKPGTIKVGFRIEGIYEVKGRDRNACYNMFDADELYTLELQNGRDEQSAHQGVPFKPLQCASTWICGRPAKACESTRRSQHEYWMISRVES